MQQFSTGKVWIMPIIEQGWLIPGFAQDFPFTKLTTTTTKTTTAAPLLYDAQYLLRGEE